MGVTTRADEARREANEKLIKASKNIEDAIHSLEEMINPDTWGFEWESDFEKETEDNIDKLIKMKRKLAKMAKRY